MAKSDIPDGLDSAVAISAGYDHTCAIEAGGAFAGALGAQGFGAKLIVMCQTIARLRFRLVASTPARLSPAVPCGAGGAMTVTKLIFILTSIARWRFPLVVTIPARLSGR